MGELQGTQGSCKMSQFVTLNVVDSTDPLHTSSVHRLCQLMFLGKKIEFPVCVCVCVCVIWALSFARAPVKLVCDGGRVQRGAQHPLPL